jgi:hypothetical protein
MAVTYLFFFGAPESSIMCSTSIPTKPEQFKAAVHWNVPLLSYPSQSNFILIAQHPQ